MIFAADVFGAEITLFKRPEFAGEQLTLVAASRDLATHDFRDQASSAIVASGRWIACSQPNFSGDCVVLEPGRYDTLDPLVYHRMESIRVADPEETPAKEAQKR
ncbi:MAG: beta/gamma crystallin-related protein [Bacillota bacterium]